MAAGDLVRVGGAVEVGFYGYTYANFYISDISGPKRAADLTVIPDERGATVTKIYTNPNKVITVSGVLKNTLHAELTAMEAMKPGDTFTMDTGSTYCVQDAPDIKRGAKETRVSITAIKEDSMTYT